MTEGTPSGERAIEILAEWLAAHPDPRESDLDALCREHEDLADALRSLFAGWRSLADAEPGIDLGTALAISGVSSGGHGPEPSIALDPDTADGEHHPTRRLVARLAGQRAGSARYVPREQIGHGGMGSIRRIWDRHLRRHLAMKVLRVPKKPETPLDNVRRLARFLEEAQITSQLEHPGIPPVHDVGLGDDGHAYFTMPLVRGRDLQEVLDARGDGEEWTLARSLGVIVKVCESLAFAHARGVIHRDLKPANVMVGRFGEVYVMDWGLARVLDQEDSRDLRLAPASTIVETERHEERTADPDSPLMTVDGQALGTPCYMAPEQAWGRADEVGPWSDVYSVGGMLYHLLTGAPPYLGDAVAPSAHALVERVRNEPPAPVLERNPSAPRALAAITEKAMAREPRDRYPDALALARDIEAFLDDRPTRAAAPGRLETARLAIKRNLAVCATAAAALLLVLGGLVAFVLHLQGQASQRQRMLDFMSAQALGDQLEAAYPIHPDSVERMDRWLDRARDVLGREATYRRDAELALAGAPPTEHELAQMLANMDAVREILPRLERHREIAEGLREVTIDRERDAWARVAADPSYAGIDVRPQVGLVPLRADPDTRLWEFWVVASGERPDLARGKPGYEIRPETGIVLVLLKGGRVTIGSPADEPGHLSTEDPIDVVLAPFFLSKYETTQAQWERIMGDNPSGFPAGDVWRGYTFDLRHPVEQVNWFDCERYVRRLGLVLPTEAQWEYACRAGNTGAYYCGTPDQLEFHENLLDLTAYPGNPGVVPWEDGYVIHAPVGTFEPNAFGLYDMQGNVGEWCRDLWDRHYRPVGSEPGDGLQTEAEGPERCLRGAHSAVGIGEARSAFRQWGTPRGLNHLRGVRTARPLHEQ